MKKRIGVWIGLVIFLCVLAIPAIHAVRASAAAPAPAEHPEYRDAVNELRNARKHLEKANADGYGHRDRAMQHIDEALEECEQAVRALH